MRFSLWLAFWTGIDTSNALLEEIRKEKERKSEGQSFLLEPLLALTGSLTLTQTEAVSGLHKCDLPTQLYLNGKLGIQEAILWLHGRHTKGHRSCLYNEDSMVGDGDDQKMMGLNPNSIRDYNTVHDEECRKWSRRKVKKIKLCDGDLHRNEGVPTCLDCWKGLFINLGFSSRNYFVDEKAPRGIGGGNIGFSNCIVTDLLIQEKSWSLTVHTLISPITIT